MLFDSKNWAQNIAGGDPCGRPARAKNLLCHNCGKNQGALEGIAGCVLQ